MIQLALILLGWLAPETGSAPASPAAGPVPGLYVERGADGGAGCDNPDANRFELHLATGGIPPHHRSTNVGRIEIMIEARSDSAVLTATDSRWRFRGGDPHTIGLMRDGVTSGFLIGSFSLVLAPGEAGDLALVEALSSRVRRPGPAGLHIMAQDGRTPDGRDLRAFSPCPPAAADQPRPR